MPTPYDAPYKVEQREARAAGAARRIDIGSDHPGVTKNGRPGSLQVQAGGNIYEVQRSGMLRRLTGPALKMAQGVVVKAMVDRVAKKVAQKEDGDGAHKS